MLSEIDIFAITNTHKKMQQEETVKKSDRTKIYFLSVAIIALLGTNAYFFFKDKQESKKFITVNTEKDKLELDVEKIEVELDKITASNVILNEQLADEQELARNKIKELKTLLQKHKLTKGELDKAKEEIAELTEFVRNYIVQITSLQKENGYLRSERDSLQKSINIATEKADELEQKNANLNKRVKAAAALKASNISVEAHRLRGNGKSSIVTKASTADILRIKFNIVNNDLATKDYHNIYMRVIDPAGNLIAKNDDIFTANDQELQYSQQLAINFKNDNSYYNIDWVNPNPFIKGVYSLVLYANGYTMGRSSIELK